MPKFESTLRRSNYFALLQSILLIGSLASVFYLLFSGLIKALLVFCLMSYFVWNLYSHRQWKGIGQDQNGWYIERRAEKNYVNLAGDSTVTGFVTILRFKRQEKYFKESCLIFRDSLPADLYRQLIVRLKYFNRETD